MYKRQTEGFIFRVWAPNARQVSVVGDFNNWDGQANPMEQLEDKSIWECVIPDLQQFDIYKYCITAKDGRTLMKADPYAFHAQTSPETASKLYDIEGYAWDDAAWYESRKDHNPYRSPMPGKERD